MAIVVQLISRVWCFATPRTAACHISLSFTISWSLLKLMSIESMMPSNHLIPLSLHLACPQSFRASGSFSVSWPFASPDQSIGASASASVLPVNIQGWLPLGLTGCCGYSPVIIQVAFTPGSFSICKTAQRIWLRILSIALKEKLKVLDFV